MTIQVQVHRDPIIFRDLAEEWTALLRRSVVDSFFLTPKWQEVWWRHFGAGRDLLVLLARGEEDRLVGIAPMIAFEEDGRHVLQFVGGVDVSDYLDFVVDQDREAEVYRAFLQYLLSDEAPPWNVLDLHGLPGDSPTHSGILGQVCEECCPGRVKAQKEQATPYIPLPNDWETYLQSINKKQRHEIRRKLRRADREAEVYWHRLDDPARLEEEVATFIQLHRASHPEKDAFMTPEMEAFFHDVAQVTFAAGWLSLYTLWLDGRPTASMWCFDYGKDLLVYNSGYDPAWRPELSSGIVLLSYCIQDAIARGVARFDFLRGDEPYKYRFGAVESAVYRLVVYHPNDEAHPSP